MHTTTVDPTNSNSIDSLTLFITDPNDKKNEKGIKGAKWVGQVTYSFMATAPDYATPEERENFVPLTDGQRATVEQALRLWEEVAGIDFEPVSDEGNGGLIRFGTSTVVGSYARYPGEAAADGDIWLRDTATDLTTMIHEVGHAIGLKHPGNYNQGCDPATGVCTPNPYLPAEEDNRQYTVMSYNNHPDTGSEPKTPMLYDIAAVQKLYGANSGTRNTNTIYGVDNNTGDPAYSWNAFTPFVMTIWDGGGDSDTINVSNQLLPVTLNLRAGSFSSVGPQSQFNSRDSAVNNLAIAYGVTIENAIGGIRDDNLLGNEVANTLSGGYGNDRLLGLQGSDVLNGDEGDDFLFELWDSIESGSINQLFGGKNNDTYTINQADNNIITEYLDEGTDTVSVQSGDYTLGNNLEDLNLLGGVTGRGNDLRNTIIGNHQTNYLYGEGDGDILKGEAGNDELYGGSGGDFMYGGTEDDYLDGWEGDDFLYSGATSNPDETGTGNDVLVAWTGSDRLYGQDGDDWLDGSYDSDKLYGGAGNDILGNPASAEGGEPGDDEMYGGADNDKLYGGAGQDLLDGGLNSDEMYGGADNDTYIVDDAGDIVGELLGAGIDSVQASINYTLPDHVEHLRLLGTTYIGTGNALSNTINGNTSENSLTGIDGDDQLYGKAGNDLLSGGNGKDLLAGEKGRDVLDGGANDDSLVGGADSDILTGGAGRDKFIYDSKTEGVDTITDFSVIDDTIYIHKFGFGGGLVEGILKSSQFVVGATATRSSDRFLYDKSSGMVRFDIDGKGSTKAIDLAKLSSGLNMTYNDFYIVA